MSKKHYVGRVYRLKDKHKIHCYKTPQSSTMSLDRSAFGEAIVVTNETKKLIQTVSKAGEQIWFSKQLLGKQIKSEAQDNPCSVLNNVVESLVNVGKEYPNLKTQLKDVISELIEMNNDLEKSF